MISICATTNNSATVRTEQVQRLVREVASLILDGALLEVGLDVDQRSDGDEKETQVISESLWVSMDHL